MERIQTITALRIGLASPEVIRSWSHGEVTKPETINYRTQEPEHDGLFCEVIFGPIHDWSCACGQYQNKRQAGLVCEHCGVELAPATVRRERMGHIELATPVVHPWYLRDHTLSILLDLSPRHLSALLAYQRYLVLEIDEARRETALTHAFPDHDHSGQRWPNQLAGLRPGDLLDEAEYQTLSRHFPDTFLAKTGAEAVFALLTALDLDALAESLHNEVQRPGSTQKRTIKRLHLVEGLRASAQHPAWMLLSVLPVLPPELRPLLILDGGRIASADVNALYARVISRNMRIKRFLEQGAPDIILNNERRLLQEACHALFDNGHARKPVTDSRGRVLKSLTDAVQGKRGRFRRNLLGKRVDYSGRSVIVAGPTLLLHECGLPKEMACELFKPFLIRKLLDRQYAHSPRAAKRLVERRDARIWDLLDEVLFERVVLLNRAPTLHRLSIQAFQPRLIEGKAIQLHPLVCAAFNADFDGDQMAVHVPLSEAAQKEASRLLLSTHNLRHPASGDPSLVPSQEIVLGCFYLTEDRPSKKKVGQVFTDADEACLAYAAGVIDLHTPILVRIGQTPVYEQPPPAEPHLPDRGRVTTTIGRLLLNEILPQPLYYRNYPMNKERLKALVAECLSTCGETATVHLLDELKRIGYHYATKSGTSFALSDITIPPERDDLIAQGQTRVKGCDDSYHAGEMTREEWSRQVIDVWTQVTNAISGKLEAALDPYGTIMTIVKSGATKAQFQQIRQLSGIRGLMAGPSGKILPVPVLSNYLLGLLVWEIFIAASGARKGFMDRSLNTAMAGYLTRRLVEAGMEVLVTQEDCHTTEGLLVRHKGSHSPDLPSLRRQIIGRVLAEPLGDLPAGTLIDEHLTEMFITSERTYIRIRSPLHCQAPYGICRQCYGTDLATGKLVRRGAAVGIIAGQAIGEPGTQLTMRTFHSGGIANNASDITLGLPHVNDLFEVRTPVRAAPLAKRSGVVTKIVRDTTTGGYNIHFRSHESEEQEEWSCTIPFRGTPTIQEGQVVELGTPLIEGPLNPHELFHLRGRDATARYLLHEVQRVYRAAGAVIHDKHLEVIIRQLLRFVQVSEVGDTDLLPGAITELSTFQHAVTASLAQGGRPALAHPVLLGLTGAASHTSSWIAAASFQDTSRVLSRAAIFHQQDDLVGLKEQVIIGTSVAARG